MCELEHQENADEVCVEPAKCELEHSGVEYTKCELEHRSPSETALAVESPHLDISVEVAGSCGVVISDDLVPARLRQGQLTGIRTAEVSNSEVEDSNTRRTSLSTTTIP